jgi:hypothetical protein
MGLKFSALLSLKAIAYHDDAVLAELPKNLRHDLMEAVKGHQSTAVAGAGCGEKV